jgi:hypothetical protein
MVIFSAPIQVNVNLVLLELLLLPMFPSPVGIHGQVNSKDLVHTNTQISHVNYGN